MIKRGILCVFMALAVTFSGFSDEIYVTGKAPTFKANDPSVEQYMDDFNRLAAETFDSMFEEIQDMVDSLIPPGLINSSNLLTGFGTSSVFSSHGATMRAYADYKFMSISLGSILGLKLPEGSTDTFTSMLSGGEGDLSDLLSENMVFGINPQFFSLHVGFNPSALIEVFPKNLFLGLRLGFFGLPDLSIPISEATANLNFNTFTIGLTATYQLLPTLNLAGEIIKWRGVSVSSGFIFQTTKLDLAVPFDPVIEDIGVVAGSVDLSNLKLIIDPKATFNININTFTIPIEVMTSIKLLFLNIPFGVGFDIGFGNSSLSVGAEAGINVEDTTGANSSLIRQDKPGSLSIGIKNNGIAPYAFNFKIMTGLGFTFGDAFVIDIPITFYITDGFNLGFTLGVRF